MKAKPGYLYHDGSKNIVLVVGEDSAMKAERLVSFNGSKAFLYTTREVDSSAVELCDLWSIVQELRDAL